MKSGGPWNLRGLRPETRDAARQAARRSGMSVGEWLNSVIAQGDEDHGEPMRPAEYHDDDDRRDEPRREFQQPYHRGPRNRRQRREREADDEREFARKRELAREREIALERDGEFAREEFGEVHARLDKLTHQLERLARTDAPRLTGSPARPARWQAPPIARPRPGIRAPANDGKTSIDDAVAEIAERQRALYGESVAAPPPYAPAPEPQAPSAPPMYSPSSPEPYEPAIDISSLEEQLRYMTTQIETLRPTNDLQNVIASFRKDLTEIRRQITDALPRRAVESLEFEIQALGKRLDHSRESGVDSGQLAGLERGLGEVRDALHNLTPAENLVGFDDAVKSLAQKVDLIIAKEDPAALQQLETAIGTLRGIVSHVASNDTLNKVAEDVRSLAAKVDELANSAASGHAVSALESRLDTLANALQASTEAGQAVPHDLEKLLSGLIEKLEWVQLTHTDHAALGHLEDRIAQLIKRLDASDSRLGNLEAVERGLADLLVHLDKVPGGDGAAEPGLKIKLGSAAIEREVAEIKRSEARTLDSLEAVHGTVEQVVDRLAMIENDIHDVAAWPAPKPQSPAEPETPFLAEAARIAAESAQAPSFAESAAHRTGPPRKPIDPNLPPDHPLEPGSAAGPRAMPSAADRIAASEAVVSHAKLPVIGEQGEKTNFIAAARRAAQAASAAPERKTRAETAVIGGPPAEKPSRLRKLLVAGGAVVIAVGCLHVALRMFQDNGSSAAPPSQQQLEQTSPPSIVPDADQPKTPPQAGPLVLPVPGAAPAGKPGPIQNTPPKADPRKNSDATPPDAPGRQSALPDSSDVTGSLPDRSPPQPQTPTDAVPIQPPTSDTMPVQTPTPALVVEKLPATIGGPALRAAAMAGDAAAEFEVATRFAEGRGIPSSNEQAMHWLDRAAKQGLALAQFRLGGIYEKGVGVKKDLAMARDFYLAAANQGNGKAMHNLAVLYAEGIDSPADYRTAAHWFHKAADYGITDSQYNLAILYARGVGVEQNYAESYKWFALAANQGDGDAGKKRDEIAVHLDPQSLTAAQAAVQKWSAEPQPQDAVIVKTPPGGWDSSGQAAKAKPRQAGGKVAAPETKLN
jgi:localization factor PodJL